MLGLFGGLNGPWEIIAILVVALLLFGKRLPEVARSLGKGIVEFKKGLKGVEDEVRNADSAPSFPRSNPASPTFPPAAQPPASATPPAAAKPTPESAQPLRDTTAAP